MKMMGFAVCALLLAAPVFAQDSISDEKLVTLTVHEAWVASGRNEDKFFDMVQRDAQMSAQKRGITLPDDEAAGTRTGNWIKTQAKKDPDQLLYAVVDGAVRYIASHATAAKK